MSMILKYTARKKVSKRAKPPKERVLMISMKHLYEEIGKVEDRLKDTTKPITEDEYRRLMLKMEQLNLKMLHSLRTNMVAVMIHFKVPKLKESGAGDDRSKRTEDLD